AGDVGSMMAAALLGLLGGPMPSVLDLHQPRPGESRVGHDDGAVHQDHAHPRVALGLLPQLGNAGILSTTLAMVCWYSTLRPNPAAPYDQISPRTKRCSSSCGKR